MTKFTMLVGVPSSGKSFYAKELLKEEQALLFSSDEIRRKSKLDVTKPEDNTRLFDNIYKTMREALKRGYNVVFDATNPSRKKRRYFLEMIQHLNVDKTCIAVMRKPENCLITNKQREYPVKEEIIKAMILSYQIPVYEEGWDHIEVVYPDHDENSLGSPLDLVEQYRNTPHENPHHDETLGEHFELVNEKLKDENLYVRLAGQLHDCGKPYAKTYFNRKGEATESAHYYNHENASCYLAMFYDLGNLTVEEKLHVAYLINQHMRPFVWDTSDSAYEKDQKRYSEEILEELKIIHKADLEATLKYE